MNDHSRDNWHQHNEATDPDSKKQFDPWIIWVTFRRCWPWAVPIGTLLAGIVAIIVIETFVPRYKAEHWLQAREDYLVFRGVMQTQEVNLLRTEKAIFYTPIVLDAVMADESLKKAPSLSDPDKAASNLRKNLNISGGGTKARLVVSYVDTDKVAAMMVCNAIVDSYLRAKQALDNRRIENLVQLLEPEIRRMESVVEERRNSVQTLSRSTLGYAPGQRLSMLDDQNSVAVLSNLRSNITSLRVALAVLDSERMVEQAMKPAPMTVPEFVPPEISLVKIEPTEDEILAAIEREADVAEAKQKVSFYKSQILNLEVQDRIRFDRERYQELQKNRDLAMETLEKVRDDSRGAVLEKLDQQAERDLESRNRAALMQVEVLRQQHVGKIEEMRMFGVRERNQETVERQQERDELVAKLKILNESYLTERGRLEQFGGESAKLQFAQEELMLASQVLWKLRDRVTQIRTERNNDASVRSLSVAETPSSPVEKIPFKKLVTASGAVFMLPFLLGFLWEFKVQRVTDSSAAALSKIAPVVGEVAKLPSDPKSRKGRRLYEESVDTLRANLFLSLKTKDTRTIAVVSSMSGEGKSSVASQLAISIAKATGEKVLLVDTDLRCPDQHEIFGLESGPGLCSVLAGATPIDDAIDKSLGNLVHVIPAGRLDRSPHRLMSPESVSGFLSQSLERYGFVVFDTAPVLSAGETLAVASAVDATLLCVMRDVSRMENLTRTTRRLQAAGANIAGTVFSGVSARQYAYRYGDYHYSVPADLPS